ncbi:MAG: Lrp/AsnC family transcriptional regulator [Candidatus Nezhaarchaeota archaeon]|nr:Lrp/AsnC family transcriptional regulator [Candidatus Nezhaarchaeota archaeon]MCX8141688.1 Lrp/AsnC family transcriptional regulator [Candidatus Nezhaarchaeota archaeon]MDW8049955.1 Lrp/AsnC family transcriptional regulator [Nitrososphaerota archaeon]
MHLDDVDKAILKELINDARLSFREIARRVGVSTATVASKVRRMEEEGIIKGYTTIVDLEKLGYDVTAIIEVVVSRGKIAEVEEEIAKNPHVQAVYDVTGQSDAIIIARFKSRAELSKFVKKLLSMEYVERTITHVVLGTRKEEPVSSTLVE